MKSLNEIIFIILEEVTSFRVTDEMMELRDLFRARIDIIRARLIKEHIESNSFADESSYQNLGVLELDCRDLSECPGIPSGMSLKSVDLPPLIESTQQSPFRYLGGLDLDSPIDYYKNFNFRYAKYNQFKAIQRRPLSFRRGNRLYLIEPEDAVYMNMALKYITADAILLDTSKGKRCGDVNGQCNGWDEPYPITGDLLDPLIALAKKPIIEALNGFMVDNQNNNKNDVTALELARKNAQREERRDEE
jgi:hypothetical protein